MKKFMPNMPYYDEPQDESILEASELYCNKCKCTMVVRKKLILVVPGKGELYHYVCTGCGETLGKSEF